PGSFSVFRESDCLERLHCLRRVAPKKPPGECRRQRAECPRSRNQTGRFCITSFLQLRESDLLGLELLRGIASPSSHSSFCEEVFSRWLFLAAFVTNAGRQTQPPRQHE